MKEITISKSIAPKRSYDVIVCGGGVAGVAAAVTAAKNGMSTLLIEKSNILGGLGTLGLIKAVDNFNTEYDVKFSTYAVPMIIGELRRYQRDNTALRVSRGMRDLYNLAVRFALIDSLYENEEPFVILDDPFIAFDDAKQAGVPLICFGSLYTYGEVAEEIVKIKNFLKIFLILPQKLVIGTASGSGSSNTQGNLIP